MSDTAIAKFDDADLQSPYGNNDPNLATFTRNPFLPRLKLFTSQANAVKLKTFAENHYGLIKSKTEVKDLGETFSAWIGGYRYKAIDFRDKDKEGGKIKSYYDPKAPEFLSCKAEADKKRPPGQMSPCMAGIEFLFVIDLDGVPTQGTILCSSASWKMAAAKLNAAKHKFVTFGSVLINGKFIYQAPTVQLFSGSFDLGDIDKLKADIRQFQNSSGVDEEQDLEDAAPADSTAEAPADDGRTR